MSLFAVKTGENWCVGDEIYDGVVVERRRLLQISLGALAALACSPWQCAYAQRARKPRAGLSWHTLIEEAVPLAQRITENRRQDEEAYLIQLSGLIDQRSSIPKASFDLTQSVGTHETLRRFPLLVVQFRLAAHAVIPHHDHRDHIGVLTVTEGQVRIRSFDIVGDDTRSKRGSAFQIRETRNAILTRGAQSTLSRTRDNIHDLRAGPEGARLIDFFTLFRHDAHSAYLDVDERPWDPVRRIFDASWA